MAEIEIYDRVICKFIEREYAGKVLSHPVTVFGMLCRQVEFDDKVEGCTCRRWHVHVEDIRLESAAFELTTKVIADARLRFETIAAATVSAQSIIDDHESRGWVLVGRRNGKRDGSTLTFATVDV